MNRYGVRIMGRIVLLACFCALFFVASAESLPHIELSALPQTVTFTPDANGLYGFYLYPTSPVSVSAVLSGPEGTLAEGTSVPRLFTVRLVANVPCTLTLTGFGSAYLDISRETLSRSFSDPIGLEDTYSKFIARKGDVHWYALSSDSACATLISVRPEQPGMRLRAMLFDETGAPVALSDALPSGTAAISVAQAPDRRLLLRVWDENDAAGKYRIVVQRSGTTEPATCVDLPDDGLTLHGWSSDVLLPATDPDACPLMIFDSSQPEVAAYLPDGTIRGEQAGSATLTAYAYGGAQDTCTVRVERVPVQSIEIALESAALTVGDARKLNVTLLPENANDRRITFVTDNESVITVDRSGTVTAVGEGTARIVAITGDGGLTDVEYVAVEPAGRRWRALLIGEQNYASTVDTVRPGSIRSVESVAELLRVSDFDGETYSVTTLADAPRDEVLSGLRTVFEDATAQDLSLVYINCHGFYQAGMTFFVMADGSVLSASDLAHELARIPGEIILLADCCGSGGLLGEAGSTDDILDGVLDVFRGVQGDASIRNSRIRVIASARLDQDSYRISLSGDGESDMATVFARALCDAAGWSIDRNAPGPMSADADYNGDITFDELGRYMQRRVKWYLSLAGDYAQDVQYYPEGEDTVVVSN